jgi:NTE family protein
MGTKKRKNVALVLSGGGARGMAHIGVIEELVEQGFNISSVAGTSIGSVIGGVYISGNLNEFKEWVTSVSKFDIIKLMDFAISVSGFIKGEKVFKKLKKFLSDQNIEDLEIPFSAVAVDLMNHKEIVFSEGNLIEAIRASVSIPTVLKPFRYNGVDLVDGGVLNPLPLNRVKRSGDDILVAVDLNADVKYKPVVRFQKTENNNQTYERALTFINDKWSSFFKNDKIKQIGFFDLVTHSVYAMQVKLTQVAIKEHKPDILIEISKNACDLFEFHRSEEMIEYGRKQIREKIRKKEMTVD